MKFKVFHFFIHLIRNKYFIATFLFLLWILFFDEHNLTGYWKNKDTLKYLENEQLNYKNKISSDSQKLLNLYGGEETLEKYAREELMMSKSDEDLFIIIEKK